MLIESIQRILPPWPLLLLAGVITYLLKTYFSNGLNKYPGPLPAHFTNWWRFFIVYGRRPELVHIKLHREQGDIVRLGPNSLDFAHPSALKDIYGLNKGYVKSDFYIVQQAVASGHRLPSLFSTTSEAYHSQLRRCVNSAFSMSTLLQYEPFVDSTTRLFLDQTEKLFANTGQRCNFSQWLQFYAFDVIGEMTYSKRHGFLERNEDIDGIVAYLGWLFNYVAPIGQMPFIDLLLLKNPFYLLASKWGFIDSTFPVAKFAASRISERHPKDKYGNPLPTSDLTVFSKPDLLSKFEQAALDKPDFMTPQRVFTMAVSMAFAGSETTAITLSAVFYYLLKNPLALSKLLSELDQYAQAGYFRDLDTGIVSWSESQGLPYLNAVIKEAFRMHPAAGLPLERVVPPQGAEICGEFIKGGTIVGCSAWVIHRRPEIFGDRVDEFIPERWLPREGIALEKESARIKQMDGTMFHFGMGARTCIGKNISLMEVYKLVPSVLRRFEVRLDRPEEEWKLNNAWFVKQDNFYTTFKMKSITRPDV